LSLSTFAGKTVDLQFVSKRDARSNPDAVVNTVDDSVMELVR
jgi:hypothetical protein